MTDTPSDAWRLVKELSVVNAAILIGGGDPEAAAEERPRGFLPAFDALKSAILDSKLGARFAYPAHDARTALAGIGPNRWFLSREVISEIDPEAEQPVPYCYGVRIAYDPDWSATTIERTDLVQWLIENNFDRGFFFQVGEASEDDFMDPRHARFPAELALAVAAWRALNTPKGTGSVKSKIKRWMDENPSEWKGDRPLEDTAKERVATVANWDKKGGAPKSGNG